MKKKGTGKSLGTVLHIVNHKAIVRAGKLNIKRVINSPVVTEQRQRVGSVYDIFGPVARPYVAIKLAEGLKEEELQRLVHKHVYLL